MSNFLDMGRDLKLILGHMTVPEQCEFYKYMIQAHVEMRHGVRFETFYIGGSHVNIYGELVVDWNGVSSLMPVMGEWHGGRVEELRTGRCFGLYQDRVYRWHNSERMDMGKLAIELRNYKIWRILEDGK
jgi:hypothetical protein